jgi:hypothetical protein
MSRSTPALWGGDCHLGAGVAKHVVGGGKLLEPETGLFAGVAERIVGRQDHQDFHLRSPLRGSADDRPHNCGLSQDIPAVKIDDPKEHLRL